jgi:hypothetical protein
MLQGVRVFLRGGAGWGTECFRKLTVLEKWYNEKMCNVLTLSFFLFYCYLSLFYGLVSVAVVVCLSVSPFDNIMEMLG